MSILTGLVHGFGQAATEARRRKAEENLRRDTLEMEALTRLATANNPELQRLAVAGLLESASGRKKRKGGLAGFLGELERSPYVGQIEALLTGDGAGGRPAALPSTSLVTGGARDETDKASAPLGLPAPPKMGGTPITTTPATTPATTDGTTPADLVPARDRLPRDQKLFLSPEDHERLAREYLIEDMIRAGASDEEIRQAVFGIRPETEPEPVRGIEIEDEEGQKIVDPTTGRVIARFGPKPQDRPRGPTKFIETDRGQHLVDLQTGRVIRSYGPRPSSEVPRDRPEYLDAVPAQEQIARTLETRLSRLRKSPLLPGSPGYEQEMQKIRAAKDELARQYGYRDYADLQRQAAFRRREPGGIPEPPSGLGTDETSLRALREQERQLRKQIEDARARGIDEAGVRLLRRELEGIERQIGEIGERAGETGFDRGGIQGQGQAKDDERMMRIIQRQRAGEPLTQQEADFAQAYQRYYADRLAPGTRIRVGGEGQEGEEREP